MVSRTLVLILFAFGQESVVGSEWISVDQDENRCVLRDLGDRPDGDAHGMKIWFGRELIVKCSFYVGASRVSNRNNCILSNIVAIGLEDEGRHYGLNVALFDPEGNLIACDGIGHADTLPVIRKDTGRSMLMPIPMGIHTSVNSIKTAYYESSSPIGKPGLIAQEEISVESVDGDTGETKIKSWPKWKNPRELQGIYYNPVSGSRLLRSVPNDCWRAESLESACSFSAVHRHGSEITTGKGFPVAIGDRLNLKAECRFRAGEDGSLKTSIRFVNSANSKRFGQAYVAFFDVFDNLVACLKSDIEVDADATNPLVTVDGKIQRDAVSFHTLMPVPLPTGFLDKISYYKITLYESEFAIGEK